MDWKFNWPGWLLCFVCGLLDATCFVALGGTFVGLMTGNLILMGISLGGTGLTATSLVFLLPFFSYSAGAFVAGGLRLRTAQQPLLLDVLWVGWLILLIATVLVWVSDPHQNKMVAWLVVAVTSIYMGFQSGCLYLTRKGHMTTNVMTSTLSTFLADAPAQLLSRHVAWSKAVAITSFLFGAVAGGWLSHMAGIGLAYGLALLIAFIAIIGEVRQMLRHDEASAIEKTLNR